MPLDWVVLVIWSAVALLPLEKLLVLVVLPSPIKKFPWGTFTISIPNTLKLSASVVEITGLVFPDNLILMVWEVILPVPAAVRCTNTPIPSETASTVKIEVAAVAEWLPELVLSGWWAHALVELHACLFTKIHTAS